MKNSAQIILAALIFSAGTLNAQDYFSDRSATGLPVSFTTKDGKKNFLFNADVNVSDASSLKVNFFKQTWKTRGEDQFEPSVLDKRLGLGWGVFTKAKATAGLGSILKSGNFDPGFETGAYLAITLLKRTADDTLSALKTSSHTVILSSNVSFASHQLFNPSESFANQLSTRQFNSPGLGVSWVYNPALKTDNLLAGASFSYKRMSNFDDLDSFEIKEDSVISSSGINRNIVKVNPKGYEYGRGAYEHYHNFNLRAHVSYIPASLGAKLGIIFYPSVDLSGLYAPRYNLGLSFNFLTEGNPALSKLGIFFELNDLNNAKASTKPFLKRSFKLGVSTALNLITAK